MSSIKDLSPDEKSIGIYESYLSITEKTKDTTRVFLVDLTCPKDFTIVKEISAADQIYDPQKYVVTGVNSQLI